MCPGALQPRRLAAVRRQQNLLGKIRVRPDFFLFEKTKKPSRLGRLFKFMF